MGKTDQKKSRQDLPVPGSHLKTTYTGSYRLLSCSPFFSQEEEAINAITGSTKRAVMNASKNGWNR